MEYFNYTSAPRVEPDFESKLNIPVKWRTFLRYVRKAELNCGLLSIIGQMAQPLYIQFFDPPLEITACTFEQ
jgi:hypothetical protein